jgi:hypothetical protein
VAPKGKAGADDSKGGGTIGELIKQKLGAKLAMEKEEKDEEDKKDD